MGVLLRLTGISKFEIEEVYLKSQEINDVVNGIQLERIMQRIDRLSQIGRTEQGGITRLAFTDLDNQARALIIEWMNEAGLSIRISPIGNIIGHLKGKYEDGPVIMAGSHIDTVIEAGRLDGILGVVAALEVAHVLNEMQQILNYPLEIVCFAMEESVEFGTYAFGSKVMAGQQISDDILLAQNEDGKMLAEAIFKARNKENGNVTEIEGIAEILKTVRNYIKDSYEPAARIRAFVELHIEQGPELDTLGKHIGAVIGCAAPSRLKVTFSGVQNHSGTTPMAYRKDALAAAAETILAVEKICNQYENVVGTVGVIKAEPNAMTVIPGKAHITIDVRSISKETKAHVVNLIQEEIKCMTKRRGISDEIKLLTDEVPQLFSETILNLIEKNSLELGIEAYRLPSGAGHDAVQMAQIIADTGMIFVPSHNGISHDPQEWTDEKDILRGTQVLLLTLLDLSK